MPLAASDRYLILKWMSYTHSFNHIKMERLWLKFIDFYLQETFKFPVGMFLHSNERPPEGDRTLISVTVIFLQTDELPQISEPIRGSCLPDVVPVKSLMTMFDIVRCEGLDLHNDKSFCA